MQSFLTQTTAEWSAFCRARKVVSPVDAFFLATLFRKRRHAVAVNSKLLRRRVWMRPRSSDWAVFMKVLGNMEYSFDSDNGSPKLIIDAGANIGLATLFFAWKYPGAQIAAIEPETSNLEVLRRNCGDLPSVRVIPAALWSGRSELFISDPNSEKWTFSVTDTPSCGPTVLSTTIADILRESGSDRIDILKLDIEGAERELFREGWQEWLPKVRTILIELHDRFVPGCSKAFYSAILTRPFRQEILGENVLIRFEQG